MAEFGIIGEVGAAFILEDKASAALARIGAAFDGVQKSTDAAMAAADKFSTVQFTNITRSLSMLVDKLDAAVVSSDALSKMRFTNTARSVSNLTNEMTGLDAVTGSVAATVGSTMNVMVAETDRAAIAMRALHTQMTQVRNLGSSMSSGMGGFGGGFGGGGGHGGGRGGGPHGRVHLGPGGVGAAAGMAGGMGGIAAMGGAFLGYKMIEEAAVYDQNLRFATQNLGVVDPGSEEGLRVQDILDSTMRGATQGTQFSLSKASGALSDMYGIAGSSLTGTPEEKAKNLSALTSTGIRFAEAEVGMGHGELKGNLDTFIETAHLFRKYKPDEMQHVADQMLSISRMTGVNPEQLLRSLKYLGTTGGLMGVAPEEMLSITGHLMQSGIGGTTAGTGPAQLLQSLMKAMEDPKQQGHMHKAISEQREFREALHGSIGTGRQPGETKEHHERRLEAWDRLGVMDEKTHRVRKEYETPEHDIKFIAILEKLSQSADVMKDPQKFAAALLEAADVRGGRMVATFLKEGLPAFHRYMEQEKLMTEKVGVGPTQAAKSEGAMGEFQQLSSRVNDFGVTVGKVSGFLERAGTAAKFLAEGLEMATNWMAGKGGVPAVPEAIARRLDNANKFVPSTVDEMWDERRRSKEKLGPPLPPAPTGGEFELPHPADPHGTKTEPDILHRESYRQPAGNTNVHIENIHFAPGTPREHVDELMSELSRRLGRAQQNDLGSGWGSTQSGYANGRTVSL